MKSESIEQLNAVELIHGGHVAFGSLKGRHASFFVDRINILMKNWEAGRTVVKLIENLFELNEDSLVVLLETVKLYGTYCPRSAYGHSMCKFNREIRNVISTHSRSPTIRKLVDMSKLAYHMAWSRMLPVSTTSFAGLDFWTPNEFRLVNNHSCIDKLSENQNQSLECSSRNSLNFGILPNRVFNTTTAPYLPEPIRQMYRLIYAMVKFRHHQFPLHKNLIMKVMGYVSFNMYASHFLQVKEFASRSIIYCYQTYSSWQHQESLDLLVEYEVKTPKGARCFDLALIDSKFEKPPIEELEMIRFYEVQLAGTDIDPYTNKALMREIVRRRIHPSLIRDPEIDYKDLDAMEKLSRRREREWETDRDVMYINALNRKP